MATPFEVMQQHYRQRDLAAKDWKARGGKVVGYFCGSVPEEMIMAAGFFPLRLSGDPDDQDFKPIDKYFPAAVYYEGFVRSQLNRLLGGKYDLLDYLIIPHSRDTIAPQYSHLSLLQDLDPSVKLPELYWHFTPHKRNYTSQFYAVDRVRDLKAKLEEWAEKKLSDRLLSEAIAATNENRSLLQQVAALRAANPPRISGVEAMQIIGSSLFMHKIDHNRLLSLYLKGADKLPPREGARLFLESSPQDNLQLYELVESCGATIVAEDHCWGNRYFDSPIATEGDPLENIALGYHFKSPCPYNYFPENLRTDYCLEKAREAKAQGVLFYIAEYDSGQLWDYLPQNQALKERGIPTLALKNQKYKIADPAELKASITEFIKEVTR